MDDIPIVIYHIGTQRYFLNNVKINSLKNKVIVIGDQKNNVFQNNQNVQHINQSELNSINEIRLIVILIETFRVFLIYLIRRKEAFYDLRLIIISLI